MAEFLKLKRSNCKNCYRCIRACPVKSIRFSAGQANIVGDECILCGQCFVVCPQNAKEIASGVEQVKVLLAGNAPVYASVAPSFIANYNGAGIEVLETGLKALGFAGAEETAIGATHVKTAYEQLLRDGQRDVLISSCCHSINLLIQKYYPDLLPYLADVASPMQAHCLDIKRRHPDARTVFIGPCLAKKDEADRYQGIVDAVLTFEELTEWFKAQGVALGTSHASREDSRARLFPTTGGILKTMACDRPGYTYLALDGTENCKAALEDIRHGNLHHCFIEMSACIGSCIGGPVMEKYHHTPIRDFAAVSAYAGGKDFPIESLPDGALKKRLAYLGKPQRMPGEQEIRDILRQMGKTKPEHELNCGTCGYNTCREKAIAVYQGKADLSMCLPFLKDRAEHFSNSVLNNAPNGIIVLNDKLEVQQINRAALSILNLRSASDVLGEQVIRILDPQDFMQARDTGRSVRDRRTYLAEYGRYVDETIVYDREFHQILCILRDVTEQEQERERRESMREKTIETADQVVDKQMRIVQEIASLLGETAAETKIALAKLKESISDE